MEIDTLSKDRSYEPSTVTNVKGLETEIPKRDLLEDIPTETFLEILSFLKDDAYLNNCLAVSKKWHPIVKQAIYAHNTFDYKKWKRYFGKIESLSGNHLYLPANVNRIRMSQCPIWPEKTIGETHLLLLLPEKVNGNPLTLRYFGELIKRYFPKHKEGYICFNNAAKEQDQQIENTHWLYMTKYPIPESRKKSYAKQMELLNSLPSMGTQNYRAPKAIEAAIAIVTKNITSNNHLFNSEDSISTYTRCQEKDNENSQIIVGGYCSDGLYINSSKSDCNSVAIAGVFVPGDSQEPFPLVHHTILQSFANIRSTVNLAINSSSSALNISNLGIRQFLSTLLSFQS